MKLSEHDSDKAALLFPGLQRLGLQGDTSFRTLKAGSESTGNYIYIFPPI